MSQVRVVRQIEFARVLEMPVQDNTSDTYLMESFVRGHHHIDGSVYFHSRVKDWCLHLFLYNTSVYVHLITVFN